MHRRLEYWPVSDDLVSNSKPVRGRGHKVVKSRSPKQVSVCIVEKGSACGRARYCRPHLSAGSFVRTAAIQDGTLAFEELVTGTRTVDPEWTAWNFRVSRASGLRQC